jgi:hypothetical protein
MIDIIFFILALIIVPPLVLMLCGFTLNLAIAVLPFAAMLITLGLPFWLFVYTAYKDW